jgi:hypothetical protein
MRHPHGVARLLLLCVVSFVSLAWSPGAIRYVSWSAVEFFPPDLERQVRRHHRRFDRGIQRGLEAPPAWRAGRPGKLQEAYQAQVETCVRGLRKPIPLDDLVEELGVLAVRVLDANDPLAVDHSDPREPRYAGEYERYVNSILSRVRLVFYGQDVKLVSSTDFVGALHGSLERSQGLYPYLGAEFFRTGSMRPAEELDDRSVAFGVAAVSLSRGMTDLANMAAFVWQRGGGLVPTPRPTPAGHVGPTVTLALEGGFPERNRPRTGSPAMPGAAITLPPP